jgi:hypothetical protein
MQAEERMPESELVSSKLQGTPIAASAMRYPRRLAWRVIGRRNGQPYIWLIARRRASAVRTSPCATKEAECQ